MSPVCRTLRTENLMFKAEGGALIGPKILVRIGVFPAPPPAVPLYVC